MCQSFEELLVEQCAPTLCGRKAANLFRVSGMDREEVIRCVEYWNAQLSVCHISVKVLKECGCGRGFLIYVCRTRWLSHVLKGRRTREFLKTEGYQISDDAEEMLSQLSERLCVSAGFPHEIGVFLGYPLRDVVGFIENHGENYTCVGCWKVYGNPEQAKKLFASYRRCTEQCLTRFRSGISVLQIAAAA
ncbi:MAG: DUF3793 family protein [Oscillospiraceae bacterium]|nr:DUF3793 family protein [Oscillospiraceae bacterium]